MKPAQRWSQDGYATEVPYMRWALPYQSPVTISVGAAWAGVGGPDPAAPFRYLDLGCGEGVTLLILAASYPQARFVGVDLNPDHIRNATLLAQAAGLDNVTFLAAAFEDAALAALPPFDYVVAHGVYSWVSPAVQQTLHGLMARMLAPGGLAYLCYFLRPAAVATEALFHLLRSLMGPPDAPIVVQLKTALARAEALAAADAPIFDRIGGLREDLAALRGRDERYLVHEFGNRHLVPRYLSEIRADFAQVGLRLAGTTRFDRADPRYFFAGPVPAPLARMQPADTAEQVSLAAFNSFRWDIYAPATAGPAPAPAPFAGRWFDAAVYPYRFRKTAQLSNLTVSFDTEVFRAVAAFVCGGNRLFEEVLADPRLAAFPQADIVATARDMVASGRFQPLLRPARAVSLPPAARYRFTHRLSRALWDRDAGTERSIDLPSPITGVPFKLGRFDSLAVGLLDGTDLAGAAPRLRQLLAGLPPAARARKGWKGPMPEDEFARRWARFEGRTLPLLVKYGVIEADPAA
ncbi:MAG: methyltransferase domain-containing protein [Limimaricola sp.]|uniref:class I SAM-dependent methyltransferase n=1 Tax=Limimaricola sp. TaxID=2211665 RepID=UPI001DB668B5|nr:class I SAM-dependent methyltransferase [Limimaricola sp.]MBI1416589.1 methyltransferase domain-containing protein [Limimaricola sp.]